MKRKMWFPLAVVLAALLLYGSLSASDLLVGKASPKGEIVFINPKKSDGTEKSFDDVVAELKGKVVYVDFWATWCGPCRAQFPHAKEMHQKFDSKDVAFLYVSFDRNETEWKDGVKKYELSGYHFYPSRQILQTIAEKYSIDGIPRYMIADRTGKIVNDDAPRPSTGAADAVAKWLK
jgi:thiol-disulfide isomerase/thioredoxin